MCLYVEEKLTGTDDTETNVEYFQETHITVIFHQLMPLMERTHKNQTYFYAHNLKLVSKTDEELKKTAAKSQNLQ